MDHSQFVDDTQFDWDSFFKDLPENLFDLESIPESDSPTVSDSPPKSGISDGLWSPSSESLSWWIEEIEGILMKDNEGDSTGAEEPSDSLCGNILDDVVVKAEFVEDEADGVEDDASYKRRRAHIWRKRMKLYLESMTKLESVVGIHALVLEGLWETASNKSKTFQSLLLCYHIFLENILLSIFPATIPVVHSCNIYCLIKNLNIEYTLVKIRRF